MATPRYSLRFDCNDGGVGLDPFLADVYFGTPYRHRVAYQIPEGTAFFLDPALWLALLDSLRGPSLASDFVWDGVPVSLGGEVLIEQRLPKNIARAYRGRRSQMVPKRRLPVGS